MKHRPKLLTSLIASLLVNTPCCRCAAYRSLKKQSELFLRDVAEKKAVKEREEKKKREKRAKEEAERAAKGKTAPDDGEQKE